MCLHIYCVAVFMLSFTHFEFRNFISTFALFVAYSLRIWGFQAGDEANCALMSHLGQFVTTRTHVTGPRRKCRQGILTA
jgi:hypothetical protein